MADYVVPTGAALCSSCGAKIIWIKDQNGTRIPVNKTRVRTYFEVEGGEWCFTPDNSGTGKACLYHISHFLTCPDSSEHSKGGR